MSTADTTAQATPNAPDGVDPLAQLMAGLADEDGLTDSRTLFHELDRLSFIIIDSSAGRPLTDDERHTLSRIDELRTSTVEGLLAEWGAKPPVLFFEQP